MSHGIAHINKPHNGTLRNIDGTSKRITWADHKAAKWIKKGSKAYFVPENVITIRYFWFFKKKIAVDLSEVGIGKDDSSAEIG